MADKLKPASKAWHARQSRWKHNSYFGHAAMMEANARAILASTTATDEAKIIAARIKVDAVLLRYELRKRKEFMYG